MLTSHEGDSSLVDIWFINLNILIDLLTFHEIQWNASVQKN